MATPTTAEIVTLTTPDGSAQLLPRTIAAAVKGIEEYAKVEDMNLKETPAGAQAKADAASQASVPLTQKGVAGGVAELDDGGKVPASQLPSYVDDVLEFANRASFPSVGEAGKVYIALDTNITWRWGGSAYVKIGSDLALGETSSSAYRGDRGKVAYDHVSDGAKHVTAAERTNWNGKEAALGGAAVKASIVDADSVVIADSAVSNSTKRITWANIIAGIKAALNSVYVPTARKVNNKPLTADIALTAEDVGAVSKTGDHMRGALRLTTSASGRGGVNITGANDPVTNMARLVVVDEEDFSRPVQLSSIAAPTNPDDAANKQYVDNAVADAGGGVKIAPCTTSSSTTAKVATLAGFALAANAVVCVKFTYANTSTAPTLNINATGAKSIRYGSAAPVAGMIAAGMYGLFQYDGTYWQLLNPATGELLSKSGGTMTGALYAQANTLYTTYQARNVALVSTAPTSMSNGNVALVYS